MKRIVLLIILFIGLCGCSNNNELDYKKLMKENKYIILDVRTKEEYNEGHIVNSINIPYDEINENTKLDKDKIIFVYCRSGNRSSIAYNTLNNLGYTVYDLGAIETIELEKE